MGTRLRYRQWRQPRPEARGQRPEPRSLLASELWPLACFYMFSTIALANPLQLISVAPGMRRSKS
jgi:hypothetical protein